MGGNISLDLISYRSFLLSFIRFLVVMRLDEGQGGVVAGYNTGLLIRLCFLGSFLRSNLLSLVPCDVV